MPNAQQNIVMRNFTGLPGNQPGCGPNCDFSNSQKNDQRAFHEAAAYAQAVKDQRIYVVKAAGTLLSPYDIALADWLRVPEILDVDLSAWHGQAGQVIRIKAVDDVQVKKVTVAICSANDTVLEKDVATQVDDLWWRYLTTTVVNGSPKVRVSAQDWPRNIVTMTKMK